MIRSSARSHPSRMRTFPSTRDQCSCVAASQLATGLRAAGPDRVQMAVWLPFGRTSGFAMSGSKESRLALEECGVIVVSHLAPETGSSSGALPRLRAASARRRRTFRNAAAASARIPRTKVVIVNQAAGIPVLTDVSVRPSTATVSERVLLDGFARGSRPTRHTRCSSRATSQCSPVRQAGQRARWARGLLGEPHSGDQRDGHDVGPRSQRQPDTRDPRTLHRWIMPLLLPRVDTFAPTPSRSCSMA